MPHQSTLWRSWQYRFTDSLRDTVESAAESILGKADQADVSVPREPPTAHSHAETEEAATLDGRVVLDRAEGITDHVSRIVYPRFCLKPWRRV